MRVGDDEPLATLRELGRLRNTEVEHLDHARAVGIANDKQVGGLNIAVHDPKAFSQLVELATNVEA